MFFFASLFFCRWRCRYLRPLLLSNPFATFLADSATNDVLLPTAIYPARIVTRPPGSDTAVMRCFKPGCGQSLMARKSQSGKYQLGAVKNTREAPGGVVCRASCGVVVVVLVGGRPAVVFLWQDLLRDIVRVVRLFVSSTCSWLLSRDARCLGVVSRRCWQLAPSSWPKLE